MGLFETLKHKPILRLLSKYLSTDDIVSLSCVNKFAYYQWITNPKVQNIISFCKRMFLKTYDDRLLGTKWKISNIISKCPKCCASFNSRKICILCYRPTRILFYHYDTVIKLYKHLPRNKIATFFKIFGTQFIHFAENDYCLGRIVEAKLK
jgi:hypothetical protein